MAQEALVANLFTYLACTISYHSQPNFCDMTRCRATTRLLSTSNVRHTTLMFANKTHLVNTTHEVFTSSQEACRLSSQQNLRDARNFRDTTSPGDRFVNLSKIHEHLSHLTRTFATQLTAVPQHAFLTHPAFATRHYFPPTRRTFSTQRMESSHHPKRFAD